MRSNRTSEKDVSTGKLSETKPLLENSDSRDNTIATESDGPVSVLFDMNRLQEIPGPGSPGSPGRILISMNPIRTPQSIRTQHLYYHPILDSPSIQASRSLNELNRASPNISFAGAWMGYGFHEDGFAAGLEVSHKLRTGEYENQSSVRYGADLAAWVPKLSTRNLMVRSVIGAVQLVIELKKFLI
jgi:predicted NAD/FAD-binding protein